MSNIIHLKQFSYLKTALENKRLHHSYILYGPEGAGKFEFALAFAKYIQCRKRDDNGPCEKCPNCKVNKNDFIVDGHIIDLGKNVAIKIDAINKVAGLISHSSVGGNHKIVIINNAQNMTRDSRDVLLKTLEEPPDDSLIILVTDEIKKLPKTVVSRCPALFFARPAWDSANVSEDMADIFEISNIINFGKKNSLEEMKNIDKDSLLARYIDIANRIDILLGGKYYSKMVLAKEISEEEDLRIRLEELVAVMYNILLYKNGLCYWNENTKNILGSLEKKLECDKIIDALKKMLNLLGFLDTNVSKRVMLEDFVLNI